MNRRTFLQFPVAVAVGAAVPFVVAEPFKPKYHPEYPKPEENLTYEPRGLEVTMDFDAPEQQQVALWTQGQLVFRVDTMSLEELRALMLHEGMAIEYNGTTRKAILVDYSDDIVW